MAIHVDWFAPEVIYTLLLFALLILCSLKFERFVAFYVFVHALAYLGYFLFITILGSSRQCLTDKD